VYLAAEKNSKELGKLNEKENISDQVADDVPSVLDNIYFKIVDMPCCVQ